MGQGNFLFIPGGSETQVTTWDDSWCQNQMDCRTGVRIGKLARNHSVSGVRKKGIKFLEEENNEGHWTIYLYCFTNVLLFGGKKNNLPEEPVQDERSRESFREETHVPDVSIKCYPTPLHASFSSQMKEMSQHCTQISARERHWWWTSVSFLLIRIFILKKTLY